MSLEELLNEWKTDSIINPTEPSRELLNIPKLHSKYLSILSNNKMLVKKLEFKYNKMKKIKWEYYTGKLDDDTLNQYGWEPFPFVLKADLNMYMDADDDLNKILAQKTGYQEMVDVCHAILKELNNRAWELKSYIDWEKFIQGN